MADSALKRLAVQTSHLSLSNLLTMIAGLVTFPLITRLFSVADYGVMSLIGATLTVAVALAKNGVQHGIIRYHCEISAGRGNYSLAQLSSTTWLSMLGTGGLVALGLAVGSQFIPTSWLGDDPRVRVLLAIVSAIVVAQALESVLVNFIRAEQRTSHLMVYQVLKKYLGLGLILLAVLAIARSLTAFYLASTATEILAIGTLAFVVLRRGRHPRPTVGQFSWPLYWELLRFGIPMLIGFELSNIILSVGARYVIEGTIGATALGLYTAAYNLCQYVQSVVIASISQAIMPIYMQMWDQKGRDETVAFINRSLRTYALLGAPIIAGVAAVGGELLPALASDKYADASVILPWVIAGMVMDGSCNILGAGLFIHRRSRTIMTIVGSAAVLNLLLNFLLVPRIGIVGSAIATLTSYVANACALAIAARRELPARIPWMTIVRAGSLAAVMWLAVRNLHVGHRFLTIGVRMVTGAAIYGVTILLIDRDARYLARKAISRLVPSFRASQ